MCNSESNLKQATDIARSLCKTAKADVYPVEGGRNSRIYRVENNGDVYALKFFRSDKDGKKERWEAETTALELFFMNGITSTPKVIAKDRERNCVLIEWIDGEKVDEYGAKEINDIMGFIQKVHDIALCAKDHEVRRATDATLNGDDIVNQINARLDRIESSRSKYSQLDKFINENFMPVFNEVSAWSQEEYKRCGLNFNEDIEFEQRTLSIVDFGFHNILRQDNDYYFFDFEFFGWDDPAKLVADTLQHPGMNLNDEKKQALFEGFIKVFGKDEKFLSRLKLLYPLFGLKWCMIMLNPFQPGYQLLKSDGDVQRNTQLKRVQNLTKSVYESYKELPCVQANSAVTPIPLNNYQTQICFSRRFNENSRI